MIQAELEQVTLLKNKVTWVKQNLTHGYTVKNKVT